MNPLLAILGMGTSLAGGLIGAGAQEEAANKNWQINLLNYYARERERREARQLADEVRGENKLGATDARGNRTHFVPGKGWVTELSAQGQEMQGAQDREQMAVLQHDLPQQRKVADRNYGRQLGEDYIAQAFLNQLKRGNPELTSDTQARFRTAATQGLNENWDNLTDAALQKAFRSGSSNTGAIIADLGRARMKATDDSLLRANMAGEQAHGGMSADPKLANLYNVFATRAAQNPRVSYQAQNINGNADNMTRAFASMQGGKDNAAISAAGKAGGSLDYIEPQYGIANTVASLGSGIGAMGDRMAADKRYYDNLDRYYGGKSGNAGF